VKYQLCPFSQQVIIYFIRGVPRSMIILMHAVEIKNNGDTLFREIVVVTPIKELLGVFRIIIFSIYFQFYKLIVN
jgi:hypothetical protein